MKMCRDEAMDTLEVLVKGDPLAACDIEAIGVVRAEVEQLQAVVEDLKTELVGRVDKNVKLVQQRAEVEQLRVALRNRALAVRAAQGIDLHRPRYTGMSSGDGVEETADAIQAVYQEAAEAEGGEMTESFAPTVLLDGCTVTPAGWMWVLGFALGGVEWAIRECETEKFKSAVHLWLAEQKSEKLKAVVEGYERELTKLRQELHIASEE